LSYFFRFEEAWSNCEKLNEKDAWLKLGQSAIANLNVEFGKRDVSLILYYGIKICYIKFNCTQLFACIDKWKMQQWYGH